jgi:sec-independent protein translocase protein TatA
MFAGLASPSHLIIVLAIVLLLFGAKRIPELAKGLGTGVKELRQGISTGDHAAAEAPENAKEEVGSEEARAVSGDEPVQTVGAHADQRGL